MQHKNANLKEKRKPIRCGINRKLIARNYQMGETYIIKDCNSFYDMGKISTEKEGL
ncbi:MAG: hypothetical protein WCF95_00130 [bacterium]